MYSLEARKENGKQARDKLLARDPNYYKKLGAKGGKASKTGGFAANRELASKAGRIGGLKHSG